MAKYVSIKRLRSMWPVYLFVLPSVLIIAVLSYYPAGSAMHHAFFRWDCSSISEFVGLRNMRQLLGWSPLLWMVMAVWVALGFRVLVGESRLEKVWFPVALAVLPALLWGMFLLLGKNPTGKFLNLNAAATLTWYPRCAILTALGIAGHALFRRRVSAFFRGLCIVYAFLWFLYNSMVATGDEILWKGFAVTFIFVVANLVKMIPSIATAVVIHRLTSERWQYIYRVLFVIPMIIPAMVYLLLWKFFYDPTQGLLNKILDGTGFMHVLVWLDELFRWGVFANGQLPSWLGDKALVIPSLIFWGFPWVGVVGVLIYLSGLSSIPKDVYEAAELDGVGWFQKFFYIELPLITTQIRINLVLMIIGTLKDYGKILVILGVSGGPQGVAMVPGLYMFRNAFVEGYAGKACAIGLLLFAFILILTQINNKYVRVEK